MGTARSAFLYCYLYIWQELFCNSPSSSATTWVFLYHNFPTTFENMLDTCIHAEQIALFYAAYNGMFTGFLKHVVHQYFRDDFTINIVILPKELFSSTVSTANTHPK